MPLLETLVDGLDHPEGVAYDPRNCTVWAGGEAGQLYRVDLDARTYEEAAPAPGFVLGLTVDGRGASPSAVRARARCACSRTARYGPCTRGCGGRTTLRSAPTGRSTSPTPATG